MIMYVCVCLMIFFVSFVHCHFSVVLCHFMPFSAILMTFSLLSHSSILSTMYCMSMYSMIVVCVCVCLMIIFVIFVHCHFLTFSVILRHFRDILCHFVSFYAIFITFIILST